MSCLIREYLDVTIDLARDTERVKYTPCLVGLTNSKSVGVGTREEYKEEEGEEFRGEGFRFSFHSK